MLREGATTDPAVAPGTNRTHANNYLSFMTVLAYYLLTNILIVTHMCMYCTAQHICPEHLQTSSMKGRRALFGTSSLISSETR